MKTYYPGNLGGNDRRFNRNQNSYDSGIGNKQPGMYRRNGTQQRRKGPDPEAAMTEGITAVKDSLREIIGFQQRLVDSQDRIAKAQEAHAQAMQQIAACVRHFLGKDLDVAQPEPPPAGETTLPIEGEPIPVADEAAYAAALEEDLEPVFQAASDENELLAGQASEEAETDCMAAEETETDDLAAEEAEVDGITAEPALKIIAEMRENGFSYEKIADHLETQGIPYASGNGKWNRWTVSKLYKEAVSMI